MTQMEAGNLALRFPGWELRPTERLLFVDGARASIGSRAFDVLLALVQRPDQVITREQLLDAAWPGLVVEENNLSVQIATLRKVLGPRVITTIPGIGYRFSAVPESAPPAPAVVAADDDTPASRKGNLPPMLAELVGRDDDVRELADLMRSHRVVSVVGAGGIGKTRLATAVAWRLRDQPADGAWMVELAPLADRSLLAATVAQALGLRLPGRGAPKDELLEAVRDASLLLVLDNCEHLIEDVSFLVQALHRGTRAVSVLTTSQELLKIPEETVYRVQPLSVPAGDDVADAAGHSAVKLLAARVRSLDRTFTIDATNAADAVELCRQLDGLPLAIEFAAARVPLLGLAGVRARLGERFQVLTGGARTSLRRHRTLRETLAWSHGLLSDGEAAIFRRAGVFAGGFTMQLAQKVLAADRIDEWAVLDLLAGLVDKSLVVVEPGAAPRYRLLESARAYALERLRDAHELPAVQGRHAQAMNAFFEAALALHWQAPSQVRLRQLLPELDNGRAALGFAAETAPALYVSLAGALAWLFGSGGHAAEGIAHGRRALDIARAGMAPAIDARLAYEMAGLLHDSPGREKADLAQRAVALYRQIDDRAMLYCALGRLAISAALCDDRAVAEQAVSEMAGLWDAGWPPLARWDLLNARDFVANLFGRIDEGEALAHEQLALATAAGDSFKMLFAMMALEQCAASRRDYAQAVARGRELVGLARRERYVEKLHIYIANLATALVMDGQPDAALPLAREAAALDLRRGSLWQSLDMLAMLAFKRGRLPDAARILGRADAANAWRGHFREPVEQDVRNDLHALLANAKPPLDLKHLFDEGAHLSDEAAAQLALTA